MKIHFLFLILFSFQGHADFDLKSIERIETVDELYHWTDILRKKELISRDGNIKFIALFGTLMGLFQKVVDADSLQRGKDVGLPFRKVLYTWTHPIGAIGSSSLYPERAGRYSEPSPDDEKVLIKIKLRKNLKALQVNVSGFPGGLNPEDAKKLSSELEGVDVVQYNLFIGGDLYIKEWIILNPDAIESFTYDPHDIPELYEEYMKIKDPTFQLPEDQIHFKDSIVNNVSTGGRLRVLNAIEGYLSRYGFNSEGNSLMCSHLLSEK